MAELVTRDAMIGVAKVESPKGKDGMNGVHDMGGMHGHGPVAPERREARAVVACALGGADARHHARHDLSQGLQIDRFRHIRELMPPLTSIWRAATTTTGTRLCVAAPAEWRPRTKERDQERPRRRRQREAQRRRARRPGVDRARKTQGTSRARSRRRRSSPSASACGRATSIRPATRGCHATSAARSGWCRSIMAATSSPTPTPISRARRRSIFTRSYSRRANCGGPDASARDEICADLWESYL